jgi:sulfite reductase alpha subunit-like flavoprotein
MEFGSEVRLTVRAGYRDIVHALAKEAARELKKKGYDVNGHKVNAEILEDSEELKMTLCFVVRENLESENSHEQASDAPEAEPAEKPEAEQNSNVVDLGTGIYAIPMEKTGKIEE